MREQALDIEWPDFIIDRMKVLLIVFVLAVTVQAQDFNHCKESPDKATVYFYRVDEYMALQKGLTRLRISGAQTLKMSEGYYVGFYLLPGKHELTMGRRETDFLLSAEPGKTYFFQISHTYSNGLTLTQRPEDQFDFQVKRLKPLAMDNLIDKKIERCDRP